MTALRFSGRARRHLISIARYLFEETGDRRAGEKMVREIEERMLRIAQNPATLGTPRHDLGRNLRSVPHKSYLVFFRYDAQRIDVLHVVHSRRDLRAYFTGAVDE